MDIEKKESAALDDGALDSVTGGAWTVARDAGGGAGAGGETFACLTPNCAGTLVFKPNASTARCPQCGFEYTRGYGGELVAMPTPSVPRP